MVCYETWGQANQFRTNVILVCHGRGGDRLSLGAYIGPGKAFDTNRYFVVAVDAIGAGLSTTPASSGLGMRFPRYNIRDMVRAQCLALTTGLGLTQIRCVVGPSMGSYMGPGVGRQLAALCPVCGLHGPIRPLRAPPARRARSHARRYHRRP